MKTVKTMLGGMILATGVMSAETNIHRICETCPSAEALTGALNELNPVTLEDLDNKPLRLGTTMYIIKAKEVIDKPSWSNFFGYQFRVDGLPYFHYPWINPYKFEKKFTKDYKIESHELKQESLIIEFPNKTTTCTYTFTQYDRLWENHQYMYMDFHEMRSIKFPAPVQISLTRIE